MNKLPVSKSSIPSAQDVSHWHHLDCPQRLKKFGTLTLSIDVQVLGRESNYKYLGFVINETQSSANHIQCVQKKVSKGLDVLKRIKHLLPIHTRKLVVNCLFLPLLDCGNLDLGG